MNRIEQILSLEIVIFNQRKNKILYRDLIQLRPRGLWYISLFS